MTPVPLFSLHDLICSLGIISLNEKVSCLKINVNGWEDAHQVQRLPHKYQLLSMTLRPT